jgi:hypothetical protein
MTTKPSEPSGCQRRAQIYENHQRPLFHSASRTKPFAHFPLWTNFSFNTERQNSLSLQNKGKAHPRTGHEGPEGEERYTSTLSLTSAVDEVGWLKSRPGCYTTGKENRYPFYRRLGGPQGQSGRVRKISPPPGFDPQTFQPVASRCTGWAIPPHRSKLNPLLILFRASSVQITQSSLISSPSLINKANLW